MQYNTKQEKFFYLLLLVKCIFNEVIPYAKKYRDVVGLIKVLNIFINSSRCFEKLLNSIF